MLFNILADAVDDGTDLSTQAIDVVHRTNDGILNAFGVSNLMPSPVRSLREGAYSTTQSLTRGFGNTSSGLLRNVDHLIDPGHGGKRQHDDSEEEEQASDDDELAGGDIDIHAAAHRDRPDSRDHIYKPVNLPVGQYVDLRDDFPPVYSQGHTKSCTANAVASAFEYCVIKQRLPEFSPSRLFIWYYARAKQNNIKKCTGCSVRDAVASLKFKAHGVCSEQDWSYEISEDDYDKGSLKFKPDAKAAQKPPAWVQEHAHQHTASKYERIVGDKETKIKKCLTEGYPVIFGIHTQENLREYVDDDGYIQESFKIEDVKPKKKKKGKKGKTEQGAHRHSLVIVGYIQAQRVFIIRNSWGSEFGHDGHFYMPYEWLPLCYDFWKIQLVRNTSTHKNHR